MARCVPSAPFQSFESAQTPATYAHLRLLARLWKACASAASSTALAAVGICGPSLGHAQATNNGAAICTAANDQHPLGIVRTGTGSTIIAWYDVRSGSSDVFAQKVDDDGELAWQANGVPVCTAIGDQIVTSTVPDGAGGAILFWYDGRGGDIDIYAQRVDGSGNPLWAPNGVATCAAFGTQISPDAVPDGAGGAIVCWADLRNGNYDIFAQRVGPDGLVLWPSNGVPVCTAAGDQQGPRVVADGFGGAIVTWTDYRGGAPDIYAARIGATGLAPWTPDGVAVCATPGDQYSPIAGSDGLGGATIAWNDRRGGNSNVFAQRISADGLALWTGSGVPVAPQSAWQFVSTLVEDDAGGTIVAWGDSRSGQGDVYAQRLDGGGVAQWAVGGLPICTGSGTQTSPFAVRDGAGGAILVWTDGRTDVADVFAQRIDHSGAAQWAVNGIAVTAAPREQYPTVLVADGSGGLVVSWYDRRTAPSEATSGYYDVYAQRITADGLPAFPDSDIPHITGVRDAPNDQGGRVFVTWRGSALDALDSRSVTGYRVWRRIPGPPEASATVAAKRSPASEMMTRRERRSAAGGIEVTYWEAVATLPAERLQGYGYAAVTTQDSMPGSNPYTAFFITALTADPFVFYQSDIDSGYSVDNLAPPIPVPFAATYSGASNALHWAASRASDLREFRLHRGSAADFVPTLSNLILASRDTGFVDVPGAFYYKLAAADVHDNLSRYALVSPDVPTATVASLVSMDAQHDRVRLVWYTPDGPGVAATVYRRSVDTDWTPVDRIAPDGNGYLRYQDSGVTGGARYGYRLGITDAGVEVFAGEAWVEVPTLQLELRVAAPNPSLDGRLRVEFALRDASSARLELVDVAGRVLSSRQVGTLGPGTHALSLSEGGSLRAGIYFLRLSQGGSEVRARAAVTK